MVQISFPMGASKNLKSNIDFATVDTKQTNKRKRSSIEQSFTDEHKEIFISECQNELHELLEFFKGISSYKPHIEGQFSSLNSAVACLLEESSLPFSKLVEEIYGKLKPWEGVSGITMASVRSSVLLVGQRTLYGIINEDVDVLEDESVNCLWCWETRDFKLLPKTLKGLLNARRACRKKIQERVSALSSVLVALSTSQINKSYRSDLLKASQRLGKTFNLSEIHSFSEKLMQRSYTDMAEKEATLKEKELTREVEKFKLSVEKEGKGIDRQIQKEMLQAEKELKRMQEEASKDAKRREKEAEMGKQIKKQEEQVRRDQWRQAKEAAELKKKLTIQKQAKIMERFLNCKAKNSTLSTNEALKTEKPCSSLGFVDTISLMDGALSQKENLALDDLRREQIIGWQKTKNNKKFSRWNVRQKPIVRLIHELKLQGPFSKSEHLTKVSVPDKDLARSEVNWTIEPTFTIHVSGSAEAVSNCNAFHGSVENTQSCFRSIRKLLQFDKSNRPAYYGTWNRKSEVIRPRHPFKKDADLDYEIESDEEWEEEEPGESLSDCEKDKADKLLDDENLEDDEENESEGSFLVPDGYLSENEGVQSDNTPAAIEGEYGSSTHLTKDNENEEFISYFQKLKFLNTLTEQALRKCHPLIITNLMHEKLTTINTDDLARNAKLEHICLQLLRMQELPGGLGVDVSTNQPSSQDNAVCHSQDNDTRASSASVAAIPHSDLPEFVRSY